MKTGLFVLSGMTLVGGVAILLAWAGTSIIETQSVVAGFLLLCLSGVFWLLGRRAGRG